MRYRLLILFLFPLNVFCQNTIGIPEVINYYKSSYNAGLQNWDIKQDKNGIVYYANNEGLLCYNGRYWNLYPLPNKTIVRSVEIGMDNNIYVGGQDELGYFAPGNNGRLSYHSLIDVIPQKDKSFGDVWDIVSLNNEIFFRSPSKIFRYYKGVISAFYPPVEWSYLGVCNGKLYAHDFQNGLMSFENGRFSNLQVKTELPANDPITAMLSMKNDSILITTLKDGLFIFTKDHINKIRSANSSIFENDRVYAATAINKDWVALATNNRGIYIVDMHENIIQQFSRAEGLQNNNVLSIFLDNQQNLWLGLDNGIDFIAYNSAIKHITPLLQDAAGYTMLIQDNQLFAGTSNGLYDVALQSTPDLSFSKGNFSAVNFTKGQNWSLATINNTVLLGHHEGAFVIKNNTAQSISSQAGFWNFVPLQTGNQVTQVLAGHYKGISVFNFTNGQFIQSAGIPGFNESSRFVATDEAGNIWVSQPYHGVYKIVKKEDGSYIIYTYTDKNGLPSTLNNHVFKIKNEVLIATEKGVYHYNSQKDLFEPDNFYSKLTGQQSIRYLKADIAGNVWFIHEKTLGVVDLSGNEPHVIYMPELNNKMLSGFEFIYPVDDNNVFLGGEKGFYHINYAKYKKTVPEMNVQVRLVRIIDKEDSLLFGGYFTSVNKLQVQLLKNIPEISYSWKTIHFEFCSSLFGYLTNLEYSYHLKGFDENWSDWTKRTEKEYTNLPAGKYSFEVKVRNNMGNESAISTFSFKVLPPWYQTSWAKAFYILLLCAFIFWVYRSQKNKFLYQQNKFKEEQQKLLYIHELERNKVESELVSLRNEKLEADINFKNSELASSAMHLVKKGELLTQIKSELTQVMKRLDNEQAIAELKKMIKSLSDDDKIDKEWESFTKHFDNVHSDFVVGLKDKHPNVSGNDLKLCAYLRMNLSTKEIAQLMNISVRGIEISRYRLRKKLGLSTDTSLFDYLISLE